jgi:hypothetical protein
VSEVVALASNPAATARRSTEKCAVSREAVDQRRDSTIQALRFAKVAAAALYVLSVTFHSTVAQHCGVYTRHDLAMLGLALPAFEINRRGVVRCKLRGLLFHLRVPLSFDKIR